MSQAKARGPYAKTAARRAEIVRAARDSFAEHGFTKVSLRGIADHPAHAYFTDRYGKVRTNFAQGMQAKTDRAELHEGLTPEQAATLLQAVLNGLQLQWLLDHDLDIVGRVRAFLDLLFPEAPEEG